MKNILSKVSMGTCPYCSSKNLDYKILYPQDEMVVYPFICDDCHKFAREYYEAKYIETDYEVD